MYNKIVELCRSLSKMKPEDLRKEGIEGLIIYCMNTDPAHHVDFIIGDAAAVLAMLGSALTSVSEASKRPLIELLSIIYQNEKPLVQMEKELEQLRKKKEEGE